MNKLLDDNIEIILKKFHRFNYLCKFGSTCKFFNIHSKKILNFHFNRMNFVLNNNLNNDNLNNDNIHIYKLISKYLYNYKILNIKYYNFIKNIELDNFIKILILFNENCSTKRNDLFITNVTNVLDFFSKKQDDYRLRMITALNDDDDFIYRYLFENKLEKNPTSFTPGTDGINSLHLLTISSAPIDLFSPGISSNATSAKWGPPYDASKFPGPLDVLVL